MRTVYIYKLTLPNDTSGKCYIGSTLYPIVRKSQHIKELIKGEHHSIKLQRAFKKLRCRDIVCETIDSCSILDRLECEQTWMNHHNSLHNGYNMVVANGPLGLSIAESLELRANNTPRYDELENRILSLLRYNDGLQSNSMTYIEKNGNSQAFRFDIRSPVKKLSDKQSVTQALSNLTILEDMIEDWKCCDIEFTSMYLKAKRFKDKSSAYFRREYDDGYKPFILKPATGIKRLEGFTAHVNSVVQCCLGECDAPSLFDTMRESISELGFNMINNTAMTRKTCRSGVHDFDIKYLLEREKMKVPVFYDVYSRMLNLEGTTNG